MSEMEKVSIKLNGASMEVINLSPQSERELALVDLTVVQRLARLLPSADIYDIKTSFKAQLSDVTDMKGFVELLTEELAFQTSVNLITTVNMTEDVHPEPKVMGKIELDKEKESYTSDNDEAQLM